MDQALSDGECSHNQLEDNAVKKQDTKAEQPSSTASGLSVDDLLKELPHGAEH